MEMISFLIVAITSLPVYIECNVLRQHNQSNTTLDAEKEVQLSDFFWTGSGDGPPIYIMNRNITQGATKNIFVKTETVVATVYSQRKKDYDEICLNCKNFPDNFRSNYTLVHRKYWLLTIVGTVLQAWEYPVLEDKFAELYRLAFKRQQSRHLGIILNTYPANADLRNNINTTDGEETLYLGNNRKNIDEGGKGVNQMNYEIEIPQVWLNESKTNKSLFILSNQENIASNEYVQAIIHNATLIYEDDLQSWDERLPKPKNNQTEIIYSIFVDGIPILATIAAEDIKLMSKSEVEQILEKDIYMKAEPYLKDPQATPLVPENKNDTVRVLSIFTYNPTVTVVSFIAIILIILMLLLIVALLLITKFKRKKSGEIKGNILISDRQDINVQEVNKKSTTEKTTTSNINDIEKDTTDHFGYNIGEMYRDRNVPPVTISQSYKSIETNSTSTSDSSLYCPINRPNLSMQNILDEKSANLFEKKIHTKTQATYSTIDRKPNKQQARNRQKRKYLSENRVGSIKETNVYLEGSPSSSSDSDKYMLKKIEYNQVSNANPNSYESKVFINEIPSKRNDKSFNENDDFRVVVQATNRDVMKKLEYGQKSSESDSIGSFLSIATFKSFPQNVLPEPLHRVLEPIKVTYYDHYDGNKLPGDKKLQKIQKPLNKKYKNQSKNITYTTQSECSDPGIVGPVVWDIHKKNMELKSGNTENFLRDPATSRNRFEGLLEDAIEMHSPPNFEDRLQNNVMPEIIRSREFRGKSATGISSSRSPRSYLGSRPLTASNLDKSYSNHSTQPPSPNSKAWGNDGPSPIVRPLSAGPFHRPQESTFVDGRNLLPEVFVENKTSVAPLIEAIQNELKQFKQENGQ